MPIEFDHKHKNMYGYYAIAGAILVLTNYLMLKERACQISLANQVIQSFDVYQSFHLMVLIVSLLVFVLSYFHFALVLHDYKLLFYSTGLLISLCIVMLLYNAIEIIWAPCISMSEKGLARHYDSSGKLQKSTIFAAKDTIGILVFSFDLIASLFLLQSVRRFIIFKH